MNAMVLAGAFAYGALCGSFFYTLALRYAGGDMERAPLRALFSRSRCPACGEPVNPLALVPIIGWLALRGRCGRCGARISPAYPLSEIGYGALMALFTAQMGVNLLAFTLSLTACLAVTIAIVDIKTLTIPDSLVVAVVVLSVYPVITTESWTSHLYGLILMLVFFIVILLLFPGAFGGGDVKYAGAIGLLAGLEYAIIILEVSLLSGALVGVAYALATKKGLRTRIPFAPFLTAGLIVALLWGRDILLVYYRIME